MDFFEHQDRARRNTFLLTLLFIAAVVLIVIAVYFVVLYLFSLQPQSGPQDAFSSKPVQFWDPVLFAWTAIATLLIISLGTAYKISSLAAGGRAVANIFGAKPIDPDTADPAERRLLNVVEEIAIASGLPIPAVYVLEEQGINAFAAGFSPGDAIIGVTQGCLNLLSRDELQAVVAHEFSHVLYGDMRLNLKLMGILHGILVISLIGYFILRISGQPSSSRMSGAARRKEGNTLVFILLGLALMIIGYIGVFFARLIKSAVSRQREFLADAASVQFTRNPNAMAGALKKIGGFFLGGQIKHPNAEEASHLFFADGLRHSFFNFMSTHPPLLERIRRIEPDFDGVFEEAVATSVQEPGPSREGPGWTWGQSQFITAEQPHALKITIATDQMSKLVGRPNADHLNQISRWLATLPADIRSAARQPAGAQALIFAMLISRDDKIRTSQMQFLQSELDRQTYAGISELMTVVENIPPEWSLPIADLAMATLKSLPKSELIVFRDRLKTVVEADGAITLFEYMIESMICGQIKSWTTRVKSSLFSFSDERRFLPAMSVILSTLAYYGNSADADADAACQAGSKKLAAGESFEILPREKCGLPQIDKALTVLTRAAPQIKKSFLNACSECIAHDGKTSVSEAELLRAISSVLDCPIPPFWLDAP